MSNQGKPSNRERPVGARERLRVDIAIEEAKLTHRTSDRIMSARIAALQCATDIVAETLEPKPGTLNDHQQNGNYVLDLAERFAEWVTEEQPLEQKDADSDD